jgi:hypothetical protein
MTDQYCPLCKTIVKSISRYPKYICKECLSEGVIVNEVIIPVNDLDFTAIVEISCNVKGKKCKAKEAHFGGIIVQVA